MILKSFDIETSNWRLIDEIDKILYSTTINEETKHKTRQVYAYRKEDILDFSETVEIEKEFSPMFILNNVGKTIEKI